MKKEKSFDAVRMMREIRDTLSRELEGMSFEEQQCYIRERVQIRTKPVERASSQVAP